LLQQKKKQEDELSALRKEVVALQIMKVNYEQIVKAHQNQPGNAAMQVSDEVKFQVVSCSLLKLNSKKKIFRMKIGQNVESGHPELIIPSVIEFFFFSVPGNYGHPVPFIQRRNECCEFHGIVSWCIQLAGGTL